MGLSWSAMRKTLENEQLCDSLKGRVGYFVTRYPKLADTDGRVAVLVDGKEVLRSCFVDWCFKRREAGMNHSESAELEILRNGGFDHVCFYEAYYIYANQSIQDSLADPNSIVKLFAIFGRRVGKRTLEKLKLTFSGLPEWLQYFYALRFKSEGI